MHEHRTRAVVQAPAPCETSLAVLHLLVDGPGSIQSPRELAVKLAGFQGDLAHSEVQVLDALGDLASHGLIHRIDGFAFASQAGIHATELQS